MARVATLTDRPERERPQTTSSLIWSAVCSRVSALATAPTLIITARGKDKKVSNLKIGREKEERRNKQTNKWEGKEGRNKQRRRKKGKKIDTEKRKKKRERKVKEERRKKDKSFKVLQVTRKRRQHPQSADKMLPFSLLSTRQPPQQCTTFLSLHSETYTCPSHHLSLA